MVHRVFTPEECEVLIAAVNAKGFTPALLNVGGGLQRYEPRFRNGHRAIVDSPELTRWLFDVLSPHLDAKLDDGAVLADLNERCRVLCYTPGQYFAEHCDGRYVRSHDAGTRYGDCSRVTLQLYLHDVPIDNGGATTFLDPNGHAAPVACQPRAGSVLLFTQNLLHEGSRLRAGLKYTMRTEAMYTPRRVLLLRSGVQPGDPGWK